LASVLPPITLGTRLSYGGGAIANGVKSAAFTTYLMLYYNQVIGISAAIVSLSVAATLIIDAFADPFIGRWSDTTRSRWGRRHPFIYGSAVPTAICFTATWFPPAGMTDVQTGFWIFVMATLTRMSLSAFEIPTSAMASELTSDYAERTRLFSLRYLFGYAGAFGFTAFALTFFLVATPEYPKGQLNPAGYQPFAITGGFLCFAAIMLCGLGTHNRIPLLRQATSGERSLGVGDHFREMFQSFNHRGFLAIFGFGVCKYTAIGLYSAMTLYFATYLFKLTSGQTAILTIDSLVAALIAAPLAPYFSRRIGKRASSMFFAILGIFIGLSPLVLSYLDLFYLPGDPRLVPVLFVIGAVYGSMIAMSLINTSSMLADVVEDSAVTTGRHSAGTFFAASSFMQQCSAALGIGIAGVVLTLSAFPVKADPRTVDPAAIDSLLLYYVPISLALWIVGAGILSFYPIDEARHERNVAALQAREAEALANEAANLPLGAPAR